MSFPFQHSFPLSPSHQSMVSSCLISLSLSLSLSNLSLSLSLSLSNLSLSLSLSRKKLYWNEVLNTKNKSGPKISLSLSLSLSLQSLSLSLSLPPTPSPSPFSFSPHPSSTTSYISRSLCRWKLIECPNPLPAGPVCTSGLAVSRLYAWQPTDHKTTKTHSRVKSILENLLKTSVRSSSPSSDSKRKRQAC